MTQKKPSPTSPVLFTQDMPSPFGKLTLVASDRGLRAVLWDAESELKRTKLTSMLLSDRDHPVLAQTRQQLDEYFRGERVEFDVPLDPQGTPFQLKAWEVLRTIPYGETISYQEQACTLGDLKATRAVGAANGKNPISIIVPCHRVVGKSGKLTGFAGGLPTKAGLLKLEKQMAQSNSN